MNNNGAEDEIFHHSIKNSTFGSNQIDEKVLLEVIESDGERSAEKKKKKDIFRSKKVGSLSKESSSNTNSCIQLKDYLDYSNIPVKMLLESDLESDAGD